MNNSRLTIIGGSVLIIAIILLGSILAIAPKFAEASGYRTSQSAVDAVNMTQLSEIQALKAQSTHLAENQAALAQLQVSIPAGTDADNWVDQLKGVADQAHVTITGVTLSEPVASLGTPPPPGGAATVVPPVAAGVVQLFTMGVSLTVTGTTPQLFAFNAAMQSGGRLFLVNSLNFSSGNGTVQTSTIAGSLLIVGVAKSTLAAH